jgi:hypothetical protein
MNRLDRAVTRLKEAATRPVMAEQELEEVFEHITCGTPLNEMWSDAARAASAAARKARAKGGNWKKAATQAYYGTSSQHPSANSSSVKMGTAKLKRVLRDDPKASPERLMKSVRAYTSRRLEQRKAARTNALRGK